MAPSPISDIILIPVRVAEAILYLLIALYIKKRGKQGDSAFPLNTIVFFAFLGGFIFSMFDNIDYLLAGLSFDPAQYGTAVGYDLTHPSLFIANIFRDIGMAGIMLNIWGLLIASIQIKSGSAISEKKILKNKFVLIIILGISTLIVGFDILGVRITHSGTVVEALYSDVSSIFLIFGVIMYFIAALLFRRASVGAFPSDNDKQTNPHLFQRTKRFSTGILVTGFGYLHAVAWRLLAAVPEIYAVAYPYAIVIHYITHGLWILALIIILSSIGKFMETNEK